MNDELTSQLFSTIEVLDKIKSCTLPEISGDMDMELKLQLINCYEQTKEVVNKIIISWHGEIPDETGNLQTDYYNSIHTAAELLTKVSTAMLLAFDKRILYKKILEEHQIMQADIIHFLNEKYQLITTSNLNLSKETLCNMLSGRRKCFTYWPLFHLIPYIKLEHPDYLEKLSQEKLDPLWEKSEHYFYELWEEHWNQFCNDFFDGELKPEEFSKSFQNRIDYSLKKHRTNKKNTNK